jgi:hypothetical protein
LPRPFRPRNDISFYFFVPLCLRGYERVLEKQTQFLPPRTLRPPRKSICRAYETISNTNIDVISAISGDSAVKKRTQLVLIGVYSWLILQNEPNFLPPRAPRSRRNSICRAYATIRNANIYPLRGLSELCGEKTNPISERFCDDLTLGRIFKIYMGYYASSFGCGARQVQYGVARE